MTGQDGFVATDALPPFAGPSFAKADVDDLGIEMCMEVWQRIQKPLHGIPLDEYLAKSRRRSILPRPLKWLAARSPSRTERGQS